MNGLIDKLVAAQKGSRDLDSDIAAYARFDGWTPEAWAEAVTALMKDEPFYPNIPGAPAYTTSVDAALTLLPTGWKLTVGTGTDHADWYAVVEKIDVGQQLNRHVAEAPTAALAICIACLRARAIGGEGA